MGNLFWDGGVGGGGLVLVRFVRRRRGPNLRRWRGGGTLRNRRIGILSRDLKWRLGRGYTRC